VISESGRDALKFVSRISSQDKSQSSSQVVLALLYNRTSKERRQGSPPTSNNLSLYTLCLSPSNHSLCSDVPSKYSLMILHTTNTTLYQHNHTTSPDVAIPQTTSLTRHIIPPPSHNVPTPFPRLSASPPVRNTNSFCTFDTIPEYHPYPSLVTRAVTGEESRSIGLSAIAFHVS